MSVMPLGGQETTPYKNKIGELAPEVKEWKRQNQEPLAELQVQAPKQGMEVQLHVLPKTNIVVIQFVEPTTGKVLREFPQEGLYQALMELQQKQIDRAARADTVDLYV